MTRVRARVAGPYSSPTSAASASVVHRIMRARDTAAATAGKCAAGSSSSSGTSTTRSATSVSARTVVGTVRSTNKNAS